MQNFSNLMQEHFQNWGWT